jgi:hypothetical protein
MPIPPHSLPMQSPRPTRTALTQFPIPVFSVRYLLLSDLNLEESPLLPVYLIWFCTPDISPDGFLCYYFHDHDLDEEITLLMCFLTLEGQSPGPPEPGYWFIISAQGIIG